MMLGLNRDKIHAAVTAAGWGATSLTFVLLVEVLKMHSYFQAFAQLGCECLQLVKLHPSSLQNRVVPCETMSRFRWFISLPGLKFQPCYKVEENQKIIWLLACK